MKAPMLRSFGPKSLILRFRLQGVCLALMANRSELPRSTTWRTACNSPLRVIPISATCVAYLSKRSVALSTQKGSRNACFSQSELQRYLMTTNENDSVNDKRIDYSRSGDTFGSVDLRGAEESNDNHNGTDDMGQHHTTS